MDIIRVHPKDFKFLFYLYHGSAAVGFMLLAGCMFQIIPCNISLIVGVLMVAFPFFMVPPELLIHLKDRKLIFRYRFNCSTISFKDISRVEASGCAVNIKNHENKTLLKINKKHFKHINLSELSEYIRDLLSGHSKIDPMKYTAIKFRGCKLIERCKAALDKTL